ncbi:MAG: protein translocase subunit SecF [bacterium]
MFIVRHRRWFYTLSLIFVVLAVYGIFSYGFNLSIDFKGGSITEVSYGNRPDKDLITSKLQNLNLGGFSVRPSENNRYIIRTRELTTEEASALLNILPKDGEVAPVLERSNTVGPIAGSELKSKAIKAVTVVILMIVLFITFAFRGVSIPVSSWKYGLATIVALVHDVIIPTGVFVYLGHAMGLEIDLLFVSGLLAILGYSVHDTIVVFDRVRENLKINKDKHRVEEFEETVGHSVTQTMARSINTSLTLLITLVALFVLGSSATHDFAFLLIIGVIAGTYSSIFLASPLLVTFYKFQK